MKIKFLKLKNWLLLSVMGLLGLSACRSSRNVAKDIIVSEPVPPTDTIDDTVVSDALVEDSVSNDVAVTKPREPREPQVTVYGVPTVDFNVKGCVTDSKGNPVKGLQVILIDSRIDPDNLPHNEYWDAELARMSDTTDEKGNFEVNGSDRPWEKQRVLVRDIDGDKNGSFKQQLVEVDFGDADEGDKPVTKWNLGLKKAEVSIKMKRAK